MKIEINYSPKLLPRLWVAFFLLGVAGTFWVQLPEFSNLLYELPASWSSALLGTDVPDGEVLYAFDEILSLVLLTLWGITLVFMGRKPYKWLLLLVMLSILMCYLVRAQALGFVAGIWMEGLLMIFALPLAWLVERNHIGLAWKAGLILAVLTFVGHGLFALNLYPRPGIFVDMVIHAFSINQQQAEWVLVVIGVLDLSLLVLAFWKPTQRYALLYMIAWGLLTSLARPIINFDPQFAQQSLEIWVPEALMRVPHFMIPGWLWIAQK